jgi:hypothetical protein
MYFSSRRKAATGRDTNNITCFAGVDFRNAKRMYMHANIAPTCILIVKVKSIIEMVNKCVK